MADSDDVRSSIARSDESNAVLDDTDGRVWRLVIDAKSSGGGFTVDNNGFESDVAGFDGRARSSSNVTALPPAVVALDTIYRH